MKLPIELPDYHLYLAGLTFVPSGEPLVPPVDKKEYFFIQFTKALTLEERNHIQDQYRLEFKRYIPNFAFLERLDNEQWIAVKQESLYRAIERYKPEYKISPALKTRYSSSTDGYTESLPLRVVLFSETDAAAIEIIKTVIISLRNTLESEEPGADEIRQLDDRKIGGDLHLVFQSSSIDWLPKLAEIEEVQWIEEIHKAHRDCFRTLFAANEDKCRKNKNLVAGTIQSGTPGVTPMWNSDLNGLNQIIGILDEFGPDLTHCMFTDETGAVVGASHRKMVGFRNASKTIDNHATAVAGIIAGDQASLSGKGENRGIAWAARLSTDDLKNFKKKTETVLKIFTRQYKEDGATIHSNSWHQDVKNYNETARDVDNFVHVNEENFVCGSNANSSPNEELGPPGSAKNALCVSASGCHPKHKEHEDGKDGPTSDKRLKPDICAPGCGINAPQKNTGCLCHDFGCATSFAAPVISGAAALVRQYYLEGFYPDGVRNAAKSHRPSAALIKATLLNSTVPMDNVKKYPNLRTGWGLIQLNNTLFLAGAKRRIFMADVRNAGGLSKDKSHVHRFEVKDKSEPLKITLVWTDPAAEVEAGIALVNDLDLVVTSPGGTTYRGNANFCDGFSQPQPNPVGTDPNNVEMVVVADPDPGTWRATVEGRAVNVGLQGYALVASFV